MNNIAPVFIGGAGRSGTSLVVDMLGLHPRLSPIYETDFLLQLMRLLFSAPPVSVNTLPINSLGEKIDQIMDEWTKPLPHRPHNKRQHERFHHGVHHILFDRPFALEQTPHLREAVANAQAPAGLRTFIGKLFAEHCRLDGKPRWINKTPDYVQHLPILH
jgi:hypothetical protein